MESIQHEAVKQSQVEENTSLPATPSCFRVWLWRQARRIVVFVIGSTILLIGIAMILLPGPAMLVIPLGLAILATEFVWARDWLAYAKRHLNYLSSQVQKAGKQEVEGPQ